MKVAVRSQEEKESINKRLRSSNNQMKLNVTLSENFNLLRTINNLKYAVYFEYLGKKYIVQISKSFINK